MNEPIAMAFPDSRVDLLYDVVVNEEEQYSIWLSDKPLPSGWKKVGKPDCKEACLDHIRQVWVDMRPLSLRTPSCDPVATDASILARQA